MGNENEEFEKFGLTDSTENAIIAYTIKMEEETTGTFCNPKERLYND